jgi:hypothetical protein
MVYDTPKSPTPEQQQRYCQALALGLALRDSGCVAVGWGDDGQLNIFGDMRRLMDKPPEGSA